MSKSSTVETPAELLAYLFATWPEVKKKQLRTWLKFQAVLVNGRPVTQFDHPLRAGDLVAVKTSGFGVTKSCLPPDMKIHFEDASLIVIDKPEGLLSVATDTEVEKTAFHVLSEYARKARDPDVPRIFNVHRLDRDTSGLMLFAKSASAATILQTHWEKTEKHYEAVAEGRMPFGSGVFESDLDESQPFRVFSTAPGPQTRHAVTRYRVLAVNKGRTLLTLSLDTGRRNQIRVHLAEAGFPIVGDKKYGAKTNPAKRLALHACYLRFPHPLTGKELVFESPLPKELARLV